MRYRIGTRDHVLALMAEYAIRDQQQFLEAIEGCEGGSYPEARKHAEDCIADFKRIQVSLKR